MGGRFGFLKWVSGGIRSLPFFWTHLGDLSAVPCFFPIQRERASGIATTFGAFCGHGGWPNFRWNNFDL